MTNRVLEALSQMGITLPKAAAPAANYVPYVIAGNQVIISGQLPIKDGKPHFIGQMGRDFSIEEGQECAKYCGINLLAQLESAVGGDWGRVKRCLRLGVFVNSTADFTDQPKVANGVSDFLVAVLGDAGKHARAAVGVAQLPLGVAVEVDAIFEIA